MPGTGAMIVEHRFAHIPQDARRGRAWVAGLAPLFEARLADGATVPLDALRRYHHLGDAVLVAFRDPAQTLERSERFVAAQGLDHIVLRVQASGDARVAAPGHAAEAGPGDLLVLDLARPFRIEAEPAVGVALYLPRRILAERADGLSATHGAVLDADRLPLARLVSGHLRHLADCLPALPLVAAHLVPATLALCRALVADGGVGGPAHKGDVALTVAVRQFVEANLRTVDVPKLCQHFGLSRAPLYRRFTGHGGIAAYIRERRLAEAMRRLARPPGGRRPRLARLADECGFADPRAFSRAFYRKYGLWPAEVDPARFVSGPPEAEAPPMAWLRDL